MHLKGMIMTPLLLSIMLLLGCENDDRRNRGVDPKPTEPVEVEKFYFGADLSYVNQILDHGGQYLDDGQVSDPYQIFSKHGANLARFRLWHTPTWTKEVYDDGTQMYNDLPDVEQSIRRSKEAGMEVLLDFHFSDTWADPASQRIPAAWQAISDLGVLADSVYDYTFKTLTYLQDKGLMPELVQLGNETNCGMLLSGGGENFPSLNVCENNWANMATVLQSGIRAVRDVAQHSAVETKIILHVADPVNVEWWFKDLIAIGGLNDFDIIGVSYYPLWHTDMRFDNLQETIASLIDQFNKEVMILETAYPWTLEGNDHYHNLFGGEEPVPGYPYTQEGQLNLLTTMTQSLMDAGASGIVYWEPAWITSAMKDQWGTGSSWENNAFFDFDGNTIPAIDYMNYEYDFD